MNEYPVPVQPKDCPVVADTNVVTALGAGAVEKDEGKFWDVRRASVGGGRCYITNIRYQLCGTADFWDSPFGNLL